MGAGQRLSLDFGRRGEKSSQRGGAFSGKSSMRRVFSDTDLQELSKKGLGGVVGLGRGGTGTALLSLAGRTSVEEVVQEKNVWDERGETISGPRRRMAGLWRRTRAGEGGAKVVEELGASNEDTDGDGDVQYLGSEDEEVPGFFHDPWFINGFDLLGPSYLRSRSDVRDTLPSVSSLETALRVGADDCGEKRGRLRQRRKHGLALEQATLHEEEESEEGGDGAEGVRDEVGVVDWALSAKHGQRDSVRGAANSMTEPSSSHMEQQYAYRSEDGETFTITNRGANGMSVICNSRGCRPIRSDEMEEILAKLGGGQVLSSDFRIQDQEQLPRASHSLSSRPVYSTYRTSLRSPYSSPSSSGSDALTDSPRRRLGTFAADRFQGTERQTEMAHAYYLAALEKDPEHPLLLRNFARFLFEIKKDYEAANGIFLRAIKANPGEGEVLVQYAKLLCDGLGDIDTAAKYFEEAIVVSPNDCYVLAAYAAFLWNSENSKEKSGGSRDYGLRQRRRSLSLERKPINSGLVDAAQC